MYAACLLWCCWKLNPVCDICKEWLFWPHGSQQKQIVNTALTFIIYEKMKLQTSPVLIPGGQMRMLCQAPRPSSRCIRLVKCRHKNSSVAFFCLKRERAYIWGKLKSAASKRDVTKYLRMGWKNFTYTLLKLQIAAYLHPAVKKSKIIIHLQVRFRSTGE